MVDVTTPLHVLTGRAQSLHNPILDLPSARRKRQRL
jgi:hypothetical protein